jgi:secretion/DNA translocation related TadE-like protein
VSKPSSYGDASTLRYTPLMSRTFVRQPRCGSRPANDAGSVTVWVLGVGMVLTLVAIAFVLVGSATVARHRARNAADLAALAAAALVLEGEQAACDRAEELSRRNGARLRACRLDGLDVIVTVEVSAAGIGIGVASARAGPVLGPPAIPPRSSWRGVTVR